MEEDKEISRLVSSKDKSIVEYASQFAREIEDIHGEPCPLVISFERSNLAGRIADKVQTIKPPSRPPVGERLHMATTHPVLGYFTMLGILLSTFYTVLRLGLDFRPNKKVSMRVLALPTLPQGLLAGSYGRVLLRAWLQASLWFFHMLHRFTSFLDCLRTQATLLGSPFSWISHA